MKQWSSDRKIWMPLANKKSIIELYNAAEFSETLKKAPPYDFGNFCITFEQNNIFEFKYVKENNKINFDSRILKEGKKEYDYIRLLLKLAFPKFIFYPQIGIVPNSFSACSV